MFPLGKRTKKLAGTAESQIQGDAEMSKRMLQREYRDTNVRAPSRIDLIADACGTCAYIDGQGPRPTARL